MSHRISCTVAAVALASGVSIAAPMSAQADAAAGSVYFVQAVADSPVTFVVDGKEIGKNLAAKKIVGPLDLSAGKHVLEATWGSGSSVKANFDVAAGKSEDVVVHRQVDPAKDPVITTYSNDLANVQSGDGRLVVAHTAAVGPADVRVSGKVLFANIANGEALTLTTPAKTYSVDIVPAATSGPTVLGPVELPVAKNALTRVFAIGVAAKGTMDAVVQVLPLPVRGSGAAPHRVESGTGGQAQALINAEHSQGNSSTNSWLAPGAAAALFATGFIAVRRRRSASL